MMSDHQEPTLTGIRIRNINDAHVIFYAVAQGTLRMIKRRLSVDERAELRAGNIYIWEERNADEEAVGMGMERWTDGLQWGPSRTREEFLFYLQKPPDEEGSQRGRLRYGKRRRSQPVPQRIHSDVNLSSGLLSPADAGNTSSSSTAISPTLTTGPVLTSAPGPYSSFGPTTLNSTTTVGEHQLVKQTYSVFTKLPNDPETKPMRKWHLTAYYTTHAVHSGLLRDITLDPRLTHIPIPPDNMFTAARTTARPRPQGNDATAGSSRNAGAATTMGVLPAPPHGYQLSPSYPGQGGSSSSSVTSSPIVEFGPGSSNDTIRGVVYQPAASGSGSGSTGHRQLPHRPQQQQQQHWPQSQYTGAPPAWNNPHPHSPLGPSPSSTDSPRYQLPPPLPQTHASHAIQYSPTHPSYYPSNPTTIMNDSPRYPDSQLRTHTPPDPYNHHSRERYSPIQSPYHHHSQGVHQRWLSSSALPGSPYHNRTRVTSLPGAPPRQYAAFGGESPIADQDVMMVEHPEQASYSHHHYQQQHQQPQYAQQHSASRPRIITTRSTMSKSPSPALPSPTSSHHSDAGDPMLVETLVSGDSPPRSSGGLTTLADNRALPPLDFSTIRVPFPTRSVEDERALWMLNKSFHSVVKGG
ncbi:hypothetical protein FRB94_000639 [Tulasnella sp. JGI-2019a]|nr:hypothetical protein FRB94_000639 [Tulasnella sp. JGI-2019a]